MLHGNGFVGRGQLFTVQTDDVVNRVPPKLLRDIFCGVLQNLRRVFVTKGFRGMKNVCRLKRRDFMFMDVLLVLLFKGGHIVDQATVGPVPGRRPF